VLLDAEKLAFTADTQKFAVDRAKEESGQLRAVGQTLPIGAGALGLVLAAVGVFLVVRGRPHPDTPESSQPAPTM